MSSIVTPADVDEWAICDEVVQLRQWGTADVYALPRPTTTPYIIGSADTCSLQLVDPTGFMSRHHAFVMQRDSQWVARDLGSKNGLLLDGAHRTEFALTPGVEIGLGRITLIAESKQLIALRGYLARLLGWGSNRTAVIDSALRSVRMAATHRATLVLCGAGDLVTLARSVHRHARGADRPFIMCDPRRRPSRGNVRSTANFELALPALQAAVGGSLCVWSHRLPRDFSDVIAVLRDPRTRVQLIVCTREQKDNNELLAQILVRPITIPSLVDRADELDQIIWEYAEDAVTEIGGVSRVSFTPEDHEWIRTWSAASLSEIERGTRRLVAIRKYRIILRAAEHLGMASVSLSRWIGRRKLPT